MSNKIADFDSRSSANDTNPNLPVKALVRGLHVLAAMNDLSPVTISRLVRETGYPKATVIRLLQTLLHEGYVEEMESQSGYRVSSKVLALSRALTSRHSYRQAAEQHLKELGIALKWPTSLIIRDGHIMAIEADNRDTTPIQVQTFDRRRFPILESAAGIACLSDLSPAQAKLMVREVMASAHTGEQSTKAESAVLSKIAQAAKAGFAVQDYDILSPDLRVIAVPVKVNQEAIGALSLVHFKTYMPDSTLKNVVLPALHRTASAIGNKLDDD